MTEEQVERLIRISHEHQLIPDTYVPWGEPPQKDTEYLPEWLTSLEGLPIYNALTQEQKTELGRHEVVQAMASYCWGEALLCLIMSRYMLTIPPESPEYRFLLREVIEECRHQEMFTRAIKELNGKPIKPTFTHNLVGLFTSRYMPTDVVFMCTLSVELISDMYGDYLRKHPKSYSVLKKVSQLHAIEEGRHIHFNKSLLDRYTKNAGFFRRTIYSYVILLNIYFIRTMYVKQEIFDRIGLKDTKKLYKVAYTNYKQKFGKECLGSIVDYVNSWNGFNIATRWAWRALLSAKV